MAQLELENIYREYERIQNDLNQESIEPYQAIVKSIDQWEEEAIKKIQETASQARVDAEKVLQKAKEQLQRALNDTVAEPLRNVLERKDQLVEYQIDRWLGSLSEIRRQFNAMPSAIEFTSKKKIKLIKVKQHSPSKQFEQLTLSYQPFNFDIIHGHPTYYHAQHIISSERPATLLSQTRYTKGMHYFRFRVQQTADELFFGIVSENERHKLIQSTALIPSKHGWWNIDRRVIRGRKDPNVWALSIYAADEIIFIVNCDAHQLYLEYPSMSKINSIQSIDVNRDCPLPWKLLIEIGQTGGQCVLKLLDWGLHCSRTIDQ